MITTRDVFTYLDSLAPVSLKLDFDNVGLLVGRCDTEISKILVALDITCDVIYEAIECGADLIVSHHPLIFTPLKSIVDSDSVGNRLLALIENGIAAICMHTNLDAAVGGVNDCLVEALGAQLIGVLDENDGLARLAKLPEPMKMSEFLPLVATNLNNNGLRFHDAGKEVSLIGLCGGSGGNYIETAVNRGCDTFVTADIKYDQFLAAKELEINLIDADHFSTENVVVPMLAEKLAEKFGEDIEVVISEVHEATAQFFML